MTFGQKLKHIRKEVLRMTQKEFGESIHFKQSTINAIEQGTNKSPSFELFRQLVLVHHVNPMFFIYDESKEPAILRREGVAGKALLQKLAKYEKAVEALVKIKSGK